LAPALQITWTYRDLDEASRRVADMLRREGVRRGDRVAFWMGDRPAAVVLLYAAMRLGAPWVPINYRFTPNEARQQLLHARPAVLVTDGVKAPEGRALLERLPDVRLLCEWGDKDDDPPAVVRRRAAPYGPDDSLGDVVGILYTSGTTGTPKGAVHDHESFLAWCLAMAHAARWTWGDRVAIPYPLFHMGGVGFVLTVLTVGGTAILTGRPTPEELLPLVSRVRATSLVAPPTVLNNLIRQPSEAFEAWSWDYLTSIVTTSAPLWDETARALVARWPAASVTEVYSATEAVFSFLPDLSRPGRLRSVGRPAWGMEVSIRGGEGEELPRNVAGLIWTRGTSVFRGYLDPSPEALPRADGWHTCYDVGYLDDDGYLYIIDRQNDLINSGGEKISSGEVEDLLLQHPAVLEAAVIGLPDAIWGERVHAVVALRPEAVETATMEHDILAWCQGRMAAFKLPKTVRIVDQLPKSPVGKLLKRVLRATEHRAES
jgi:acyl-coenzyme A synthetase/AMP-(fatty) acid ligase